MPSTKDKTALAKGTERKSKALPEKTPKSGKVEKKKKAKTASEERPHKKKRKQERMDEELATDDEDEAEVVGADAEEEPEDVVEAMSDDEDNINEKKARAKKPDTRSEKEKEKDKKLKASRRNQKATRRGRRTIAKRAGYSAAVARAGHDGSLDVAVPITSVSEAIRACKWAPTQTGKAAFEGLTEFDERTQLSLASLPKSAARVFQAHGEQYLRRLTAQTVQLASDQLKTRATASMVASATRPLRRVQKYSFVAPKGVVRFSQKDAKGIRLKYADGEQAVLEEEKALHKLQERLAAKLAAKAQEEKKKSGPSWPVLKSLNESIAEIRKQAADAGLA